MDKALSIIKTAAENEKKGIAVCAKVLYEHGITLSDAETAAIVAAHTKALRDSGRVEFGEGALPALTKAFVSSPYITRENCAELLSELQATFYFFRSECDGLISDEKLIAFMKREFNGPAAI